MKNLKNHLTGSVLVLMLALMLALTPALGCANELNCLTVNALTGAWDAGKEITAVFKTGLSNVTGMGLDEDGEKIVASISEMLKGASITAKVVKTEAGGRITASAAMANQDVIDMTMELTQENLYVESSVIPGKRLLFRLADLKAMTDEVIALPADEQVGEMGGEAGAYLVSAALRYGPIVFEWMEKVTVTELGAQEATENCDAMASLTEYTISGEQLKQLMVSLITAAEGDEALIKLMNEHMDMANEEGGTSDALTEMAKMKEQIAQADMSAVSITVQIGNDEAQELTHLAVNVQGDNRITAQYERKTSETGDRSVQVNLSAMEGEKSLLTFAVEAGKTMLAEGESTLHVDTQMILDEDEEVLLIQSMTQASKKISDTSESLQAAQTLELTEKTDAEQQTNAARIGTEIAFDTQLSGEDFASTLNMTQDLSIADDADQLGLSYAFDMALSSGDYVPANMAWEDVDVRALDEDALEALSVEAVTGLTQAAFKAISLLPSDLLAMMIPASAQ